MAMPRPLFLVALGIVVTAGATNLPRGALIFAIGAWGPRVSSAQPTSGRRRSNLVRGFDMRIALTVSLTGKSAYEGRHVMQGLELLREVANNNSEFKTVSGEPIKLILQIEDDRANEFRAEALYKELIESGVTDVFLGPYSSGLSLKASKVVDAAGKIIMLHSAASPSIYTDHGFTNVFSVSVLAGEYLRDGLERLYKTGARKVSFMRGEGIFDTAVCEGSRKHALRIGYEVMGNTTILAGLDATEAITQIRSYGADLVVGCGHLNEVITMVITSRALMFNPKAMLTTLMAGDAFTELVGAPNANYLFAPTIWDPESKTCGQRKCRVFASSREFDQMYFERWGERPELQAAAAVAAGIAVMSAAEITGKPRGASLFRSALQQINISTIYGDIALSPENGTRLDNPTTSTRQFLPHPPSVGLVKRYTTLDIKLIDENYPPRYPMPTWVQRELDIFPCPLGYVRNMSSTDVSDCVPCGRGTFRSKSTLECIVCSAETFSHDEGATQCKACDLGANCSIASSLGLNVATAGWYNLPDEAGDPQYFRCDPPEICLGNNECGGNNTGIFCQQCLTGFTNSRVFRDARLRNKVHPNICLECNSDMYAFAVPSCVLLGYILYIVVLVMSARSSAKTMTSLHVVIMRIITNFVQLNAIAFVVTEFSVETSFLTTQLFVDIALEPFQAFIDFQCLLVDIDIEAYAVLIVFGLVAIPLAIIFSVAVVVVSSTFYFLWQHAGCHPGLSEDDDDGLEWHPSTWSSSGATSEDSAKRPEKLTTCTTTNLDIDSDDSDTDFLDEGDALLSGTVNLYAGDRSAPVMAFLHNDSWSRTFALIRAHCIQVGGIFAFFLYPVCIQAMLVATKCIDVGELRLEYNVAVKCFSEDHLWWYALAVFGIVFYGVGLPMLFLWKIRAVRTKLIMLNTRWKYGFFYIGFEDRFYYFYVVKSFQTLTMLLVTTISDIHVKNLVLTLLCCSFLALQIRHHPFDNRAFFALDRLESINLTSLVVLGSVRLNEKLQSATQSILFLDYDFDWFVTAGSVAIAIAHFTFLVVAFYGLARVVFLKPWLFLQENYPERLNFFQRFFLWLTFPKRRYVRMNPKTNELIMSDLSDSEKHFLSVALCDTLEFYLIEDKMKNDGLNPTATFFPGCMLAALRQAFNRVMKSRSIRSARMSIASTQSDHTSEGPIQQTSSSRSSHRATCNDEALWTPAAQPTAENPGTFASVEDLHMALMLSWPFIQRGEEKYFKVEGFAHTSVATHHDGMLEWDEDEPISQFFHELRARKGYVKKRGGRWKSTKSTTSRKDLESGDVTLGDMLGVQEASTYLLEREAFQKEHREIFEEIQELKVQIAQHRREITALGFDEDADDEVDEVEQAKSRRTSVGGEGDGEYIEAKTFSGAKPGYVFKTGDHGLGYYLDRPPTVAEEEPPPGDADFLEAARFSGAKPGYVFKKGDHGLGYYVDRPPRLAEEEETSACFGADDTAPPAAYAAESVDDGHALNRSPAEAVEDGAALNRSRAEVVEDGHALNQRPAEAVEDGHTLNQSPAEAVEEGDALNWSRAEAVEDGHALNQRPAEAVEDGHTLNRSPAESVEDGLTLNRSPAESVGDGHALKRSPAEAVGDGAALNQSPAEAVEDGDALNWSPADSVAMTATSRGSGDGFAASEEKFSNTASSHQSYIVLHR